MAANQSRAAGMTALTRLILVRPHTTQLVCIKMMQGIIRPRSLQRCELRHCLSNLITSVFAHA